MRYSQQNQIKPAHAQIWIQIQTQIQQTTTIIWLHSMLDIVTWVAADKS